MRTDTLYHLQRKYGHKDPSWDQAREELGLPDSYRRSVYREQFKAVLGMYQLHPSIRADWFVDLKKLADYLDARKRKRA